MSETLPPFHKDIKNQGTLETKRLFLEPIINAHLPLLTDVMFKDKEVMEHVYSLEQALELQPFYIQHWKRYGFGFYTLFDKHSHELIGRAGIFIAENPHEIELGYSIAKAHWGKGYATEASHKCLDHGFNEVGAERIIATVVPQNIPSVNVAQKLGMSSQHKTIIYDGKKNDIYMITREEFQ